MQNKGVSPHTLSQGKYVQDLLIRAKLCRSDNLIYDQAYESVVFWDVSSLIPCFLGEVHPREVPGLPGDPRRSQCCRSNSPSLIPCHHASQKGPKIPFSSISPYSHNISFSPSSLNFWPQFSLPPPYSVLPPLYTPSIVMLYFLDCIHMTCSFSVF